MAWPAIRFREFSRKIAILNTKKLNTPYINYKDVHLPLTLSAADIKKAVAETEKAGLKIVGGGTIYFQTDDEKDIRSKFEYAKNRRDADHRLYAERGGAAEA